MEIEAEGSEVQVYPWFHRQFETNSGYITPCFNKI